MTLLDVFKKESAFHKAYDRFELTISGILLIVVSIIIVYALVLILITLGWCMIFEPMCILPRAARSKTLSD